VGGDFYNCSVLPGNCQRIPIGDVSGKDAAAAMTAAVLIGAAQRRDFNLQPSKILVEKEALLAIAEIKIGAKEVS
jgi:serine phosphatase RsbU (regulator of sigma subunit)